MSLLEIFCHVDDLCRVFEPSWKDEQRNQELADEKARSGNRGAAVEDENAIIFLV